ncbi:MAG: crotonase/enoyl-CoA hydratase family protein [Bryobacteraceae bacterium]|nr:crotonase/enoyl-CoA hydratase family protein [Bryobacteraceae bacterium]
MNESITTQRRGHVFLIGLNRVAKRNAFDPPMFHALARAYGEYERDAELWCAVVFAHGDHFSGGIDLGQYSERFQQPDAFPMGEGEVDPFGMRSRLTKPVVMTAQGISYTIAVEMMLAADIRLAASNVRFAQLEVGRGLYPLGGAPFRLVREAGWGNAMRWLLTGEEFGAEEALRLGLIQEITAPGEQFNRALAIAGRVAEQAPLGVRATLKSARIGLEHGEREAIARMREDMPAILKSEDFAEGVASFRERRKAKFAGR